MLARTKRHNQESRPGHGCTKSGGSQQSRCSRGALSTETERAETAGCTPARQRSVGEWADGLA